MVGKFLVGSLLGFAWEKVVSKDLPGALPLPIRPIYGFGAVLATDQLKQNCQIALIAEELVHKMNPSLWNYDVANPMALDSAVRADYNVAFGSAMCLANAFFKKLAEVKL